MPHLHPSFPQSSFPQFGLPDPGVPAGAAADRPEGGKRRTPSGRLAGAFAAGMLLSVLLVSAAWAAQDDSGGQVSPSRPDAACVAQGAALYGVPESVPWLLMAVEGGRLGEVNPNRNGSVDYGPEQINSVHVPSISRLTGLPPARVVALLRYNGCWASGIASWVMARCMIQEGHDLWRAIGCYHSPGNRVLASGYARRVAHKALALCGPGIFGVGRHIECPAIYNPPALSRDIVGLYVKSGSKGHGDE